MIENPFHFLPRDDVLFLDSGAFSPLPLNRPDRKLGRNLFTVDSLLEEAARLSVLTSRLRNMDNWLVISEVIEEFWNSITGAERLRKSLKVRQEIQVALGRLVYQREQTFNNILRDDHRNASLNLTDELEQKIHFLMPAVEKRFRKNKGEINERNTDCKLIATSLVYAEDAPVYLFSHDDPLLKTFRDFSRDPKLPIQKTYIVDERNEKIIAACEYKLKKGQGPYIIKV